MIGDGNQRILLPDMAGVEQYVEDYTKPAIADEVEEIAESDWQKRHKEYNHNKINKKLW